jgi:type IV fimbrial biogenesis protein FimT
VTTILAGPSRRVRLRHPVRAPASCGFTLVEMLVVVAIASTLMALAVPSLRAVGDSMRLTAASNGFLAHLYLARSEAIKRRARVVMCKSANGTNCSTAGGWEQGRVVFHDANNNGLLDAGEVVIAIEDRLHPELRLTGNASVARYVSFDPNGTTRQVGGGFQAGTLTLCRQALGGNEARQIVVNVLGRPRVQKVHLDDCM